MKKEKSQRHNQVPAKVTAYVDEEIKDFVEILNSFDGLWTMESCAGYSDNKVCISACYGEWFFGCKDVATTANFIHELTKCLTEVMSEEKACEAVSESHYFKGKSKSANFWDQQMDCGISLSLKWDGEFCPTIEIEFNKSCLDRVTSFFNDAKDKMEEIGR